MLNLSYCFDLCFFDLKNCSGTVAIFHDADLATFHAVFQKALTVLPEQAAPADPTHVPVSESTGQAP